MLHGGSVAAVVLECFRNAISRDRFLGNGQHDAKLAEKVNKLKKCRNDHDWIFTVREYQRLEGVPFMPLWMVEKDAFGTTWKRVHWLSSA